MPAGGLANWCIVSGQRRFERIEEMLNVEYSPPRRGGVAATSTKSCEATESVADGVVSSAKSSGLNSFAELTTPAAPFRNGSIFIYGASTPPLRGGEYSARGQFVHSHVHRRPLQFGNRRSRLNF